MSIQLQGRRSQYNCKAPDVNKLQDIDVNTTARQAMSIQLQGTRCQYNCKARDVNTTATNAMSIQLIGT
jgi:hypothetical protein